MSEDVQEQWNTAYDNLVEFVMRAPTTAETLWTDYDHRVNLMGEFDRAAAKRERARLLSLGTLMRRCSCIRPVPIPGSILYDTKAPRYPNPDCEACYGHGLVPVPADEIEQSGPAVTYVGGDQVEWCWADNSEEATTGA